MSDEDERLKDVSVMSHDESKHTLSAEVLEGKRAKKRVERLDLQAPKHLEKLKIGDGNGDKLGDIPRTNFHISTMKAADLKPLHIILFDRPGKSSVIKRNLRHFNGFTFDGDSDEFIKKRDKLLKSSSFTSSKLKAVCSVLDLEKKGTNGDLVDRILAFLLSPKNSGKQRLPVKKKRRSKKKLSGDDSTLRSKKKKKVKSTSSSGSPKKSKSSSKSKAIIMDSSSDEEEEEEEEEKGGASAEANKQTDQSESEEEEKESVKAQVVSRATHRKPTKKRVREETSEDESSEDQQPKKKKSAPNKPGARSKKADSSSSRKNTHHTEDSSDEDKPLIRMVRKCPSDDQLKETVWVLLKEADLEQITMKNIFQQVFDTYPDHDLSSKKDFIKQAVRSIIT